MVGDDQFSFPVVSSPVSHLMQSSPLWRISSRVHHPDEDKEEDTDSFYSIVLEGSGSGSSVQREVSSMREDFEEEDFEEEEGGGGGGEEEEEEEEKKIDLLWEDFFCKEENLGLGTPHAIDDEEAQGTTSLRKQHLCLTGRAPAGGGVVASVAIVKLLKKMFLIRNKSHRHQLQVLV